MHDSLKPGLGNWVDNDRFFNRDNEIRLLSEKLLDGASVLLVAQRRIGKTSLMREAARRLSDRIVALHVDLEKAFSPEDAIVELSLATKGFDGIWKKVTSVFGGAVEATLSKLESIQVTGVAVKLRSELSEENWKDTGDRIFSALASISEKEGKQVVIFFDEVPILVNRMLKGEDNAMTPARKRSTDAFMSWLRDNVLRHRGRVCLVITGSIGIEPILNQASLSGTINVYAPFELRPWSDDTAVSCLMALAKNKRVPLSLAAAKHMTVLLGCSIPHHVQMFFDHLHTAFVEAGSPEAIELADIDRVYKESMTGLRGHPELSHMEERLKMVLPGDQFALALSLLTEAAVAGKLTQEAALKLASQHSSMNEREALLTVLHILEHDGYLSKSDSYYVFVSSLVRDWWKRRFSFGYSPVSI